MKQITFKMLDKNNMLFVLEAEMTERNGYPEFTMSGHGNGSAGQCNSHINPANEDQQKILDFWNKRHLNGMSAGTPEQDKILSQYPDVKEYNERVELLKSVKITGESLSYTEKKNIEKIDNEIKSIQETIDHYNYLMSRTNVLALPKLNTDGGWLKTESDLIKFIKDKRLLKDTDVKDYHFYIKGKGSLVAFVKQLEDKLEKEIETQNYLLEITKEKLSGLYAYQVNHNGKAYRYGSSWIRNNMSNPDKFRADFLLLVDKASYKTDNDPLVSCNLDDEDMLQAHDIKAIALGLMLDLSVSELDLMTVYGNRVNYAGTEYLVGTDEEMAQEHLEDIKNFLDDCGFEGFNQSSVDTSIELDDDGDIIVSKSIVIPASERANSLNRWDGSEMYVTIADERYYGYQQ